MILADGKVEQKELNRMYEIGTTGYGVTPEEINKVLLSGDIVFYKPESEEERVLGRVSDRLCKEKSFAR